MIDRDDGGPAFPILNDGAQYPRAEGMSLRDYFAAKSLSGMLKEARKDRIEWVAERAYQIADAMLKERAK